MHGGNGNFETAKFVPFHFLKFASLTSLVKDNTSRDPTTSEIVNANKVHSQSNWLAVCFLVMKWCIKTHDMFHANGTVMPTFKNGKWPKSPCK